MKPTIGIVFLTGSKYYAAVIHDTWKEIIEDEFTDVVFVENGASEITSGINRDFCLDNGYKRIISSGPKDVVPDEIKKIRCYARNAGAANVHGEYLWFIDGDCMPEPDALYWLRSYISPNSVITSRIQFQQHNGDFWPDHRSAFFNDEGIALTYFPWLIAESGLCVPRTLFDGVGGWSANYAKNGYCGEGMFLYWRLLCRYLTPLMLATNVQLRHLWHDKDPNQEHAAENKMGLLGAMVRTAEAQGVNQNITIKRVLEQARGELFS